MNNPVAMINCEIITVFVENSVNVSANINLSEIGIKLDSTATLILRFS